MRISLPVKLGIFVILLFAAVVAACLSWKPLKERRRQWKLHSLEPSGQPSWLALGKEVYHAHKRFEAQKEILSFYAPPRWFLAYPAYDVGGPENGSLTGYLGFPEKIEDIPLKDQGVSLKLTIHETQESSVLQFKLKLKTTERTVQREAEHRWVNLLPLLFAFFADGKAVKGKPGLINRMGGINREEKLADKGGHYIWDLKVDTKSIDNVVLGLNPESLIIVAAFSERQHENYNENGRNYPRKVVWFKRAWKIPQALVRSNTVMLVKENRRWIVFHKKK
ncbi:MAG: hypothetical protein E3J72_11280 [Planctomycetota bacterium]|nr:MAG: hypothetical protein E3J72_11280 [Planctomycetota bacterium]